MEITTPNPILLRILRYFLGSYFLASGVSKLFPLGSFFSQILAYKFPFLTETFIYIGGVILITIEVWIGCSVLLNINYKLALNFLRALLIIMIPITLWGVLHKAPYCGCFGNFIKTEPWQATLRDCLLLALSFLLVPKQVTATKKQSLIIVRQVLVCLFTLAALVYALMQFQEILISQSVQSL